MKKATLFQLAWPLFLNMLLAVGAAIYLAQLIGKNAAYIALTYFEQGLVFLWCLFIVEEVAKFLWMQRRWHGRRWAQQRPATSAVPDGLHI